MGAVVGEEVMGNKRMKKLGIFLSIALALTGYFSCRQKKEQKPAQKATAQDPPYSTTAEKYDLVIKNDGPRLWKAALDSGNFKAYNHIALAYAMRRRELELYYGSLIMANKYHCADAYFNLWGILIDEVSLDGNVVVSKDDDTKNLALYYIFKARELGSDEAKKEIETEYKSKSKLTSSYFLMQLANSKPEKRK